MLLAFGLGPEIIVFLVIVLLLFGNRLPGAMKSLGQSVTQFKKGMNEPEEDTNAKLPPKGESKES